MATQQSSAPYIALYPTDFLADVGHLGNSELGVYWRLLLVYYRDGRPLPVDPDRLRRIAMAFSPEEYRTLDNVVSEFFVMSTEPDGTRVWRHKRADIELSRANAARTKKSEAAKATNEKRWGSVSKRSLSDSLSDSPTDRKASHIATENQNQNQNQNHRVINSASPRLSDLPVEPGDQGLGEGGEGGDDKADAKRKRLPACPYDDIADAYNRILPNLPEAQTMTNTRQRGIKSMWTWVLTSEFRDGTRRATTAAEAMAWFVSYFERAKLNDFLMGRTDPTPGHERWRCDLDFLMSERGLKQVVEKTQVAA